MTPETRADQQQRASLIGDPRGDPLAVVLYRLEQIERRMDRLLTAELYTARHEAIQARVSELEQEQAEARRTMRQVVVGLILAAGTAIVTAGLTFT